MAGMEVAVITPTIGSAYLRECIESVAAQTLPGVVHWIVIDGPENESRVRRILGKMPVHAGTNLVVTVLPHNVGHSGWNGHRVYGSFPYLIDAPYIAFLDEDNTFDPDHLQRLAHLIQDNESIVWAYSLRRIVSAEGKDVCLDSCESLGGIHHTILDRSDHLIDTSCYLLPRDLAISIGPLWNARFRDPDGRPEPDRAVATALLKSNATGAAVRRHSVRYRVGSSSNSVNADFFKHGNERMGFDPSKQDVYVFHFSQDATQRYIGNQYNTERSYALDEWQMTLWRGLSGDYNIFDGYANIDTLPYGSTVLVSMCHPQALPLEFFKKRADLHRVVYTLESPNVAHAAQWDIEFLKSHFDTILTYWKPLLRALPDMTIWCPHNTHHLDLSSANDRLHLRTNKDLGKSVAMVLECRSRDMSYEINGIPLRCQEYLREQYVNQLSSVDVFGVGWSGYIESPTVRVRHTLHRSQDPRHAIDILQNYSFALIVENCDAEGYVSEKLYDAWLAGTIPLYHGNPVPELDIHRDMYIDIRGVTNLQALIDTLSVADVQAWKQRIADGREEALTHVTQRAFADVVRTAVNLARTD